MQKQRIHKYYKSVVSEDFLLLYNYTNIMQLPKLQCAILSHTDSNYLLNKKQGVYAFAASSLLTGQKSIPTRAHKSIAAFKLRQASFMGCKVTVRKDALHTLLDQLYSFIVISPQDYGLAVTKTISKKQINILNIGVRKVLLLPPLERFFLFFESLKGYNITFLFSCPFFKKSEFAHTSTVEAKKKLDNYCLPEFFLRAFQLPLPKNF